ncbi:putative membrane protein [Kitasatospora sp. GAS204A]|uniref:DUF1648 domain-containing protein n=1 Tax=unclassified Kitasatospora TaxID=2633591 RepID=UPI002474C543|nr:DUF5808 domain-containing protein [Kitasatospora sp. GAS204B]MDH6119539.1 putative membrane protein [Kitasatospora sp. GAS204B]
MSTTAVLVQALVPLLLLLALWLTPSLTMATVPFGVRVPTGRTQAPVIAEQRRAYRYWVTLVGGTAFVAGTVWALSMRTMVPWALTLVAILAVGIVGYLRAHQAIAAVKQREQWFHGLRQGVAVDTSLRTDPARFPWLWVLPSALLTVGTLVAGIVRYPSMPDRLPTHYNGPGHADHLAAKSVGSAFAPVFAEVGITLLLVLVTWLTFRARPDLDPARAKVTAGQHRRFLGRMARCLMLLTACADLSITLAAWQIWNGARTLSVLPVLLPPAIGLAVLLVVAIRSGQNGSRIPAEQDDPAAPAAAAAPVEHQDDDRYWRLGGLVYVNPADSSFFVPKRFGIGWTLNLASPYAAVFFALLLGLAVGLPLLTR